MNKKIMRAFALVVVLAMSVAALTGCGKKVNDKDEQGRTIISVGGYPSKDGNDRDSWDETIARFEKENTDVVIKPNTWTYDLKSFYAKAEGGQLPNVFSTAYTEISAVIDGGYAADLTEGMKKYGYAEKLNPQIRELMTRDGKVYGMPFNAYVLGLSYNVEMFEAAGLMNDDGTPKQPKTWDEVVEFAVKIKEATGKPGLVLPTSSKFGGWMFTPIAWSFGVDFMEQNEDGSWKATFDSPEAVAALQWFKDLKWKYDVLPSNSLIDGTEYYKIYATGGAAMMTAAAGGVEQVSAYDMPTTIQGAMAYPAGPKRHVTLLGGTAYYGSRESTKDQIDAILRWRGAPSAGELNEKTKKSADDALNRAKENGWMIGVNSMSIWSNDSDLVKYQWQLNLDNTNTGNINHVKLYNDFVANCPADIQAEEPVCAQALYEILDRCLQKVLTDENADCAEIIKDAARDFQTDYLDNL